MHINIQTSYVYIWLSTHTHICTYHYLPDILEKNHHYLLNFDFLTDAVFGSYYSSIFLSILQHYFLKELLRTQTLFHAKEKPFFLAFCTLISTFVSPKHYMRTFKHMKEFKKIISYLKEPYLMIFNGLVHFTYASSSFSASVYCIFIFLVLINLPYSYKQ